MKTHELKTWPEYFGAVRAGIKNFEVRKNDRDFKVGDILLLKEYDLGFHSNPELGNYTGRQTKRVIKYILQGGHFGLEEGFIAMGFDPVGLHIETIICPECQAEQDAVVLHTLPFATFIHTCEKCDYRIIESEWNRKAK